jgi:hypothetical protein
MANLYTIEHLLIGKRYRSSSLTGEIIDAEKRNDSVYYSDAEAYLVRVRSEGGNYHYRTIAVKVGE